MPDERLARCLVDAEAALPDRDGDLTVFRLGLLDMDQGNAGLTGEVVRNRLDVFASGRLDR